jgi:ATP-dependent protease HslVU (ClpYQ) peptidase subunit
MFQATTVLAVRHRARTVMASEGQVTFGDTVVKQTARKIRKLYNDKVLAGFAGSAGRLVRAVLAVRSQARSAPRQTWSARWSSS